MATPDEKISAVYTQMQNIKSAINTKGGNVGDNTSDYASAINSIGSAKNITREISSTGIYQMPTTSFTFTLPSTVTDIGTYAFYYAFYGCSGLTSVDFDSLTKITGSYAFSYAFSNCTTLTDIYFRALTTSSFGSSYMNQFSTMFTSTVTTAVHTVHFPSNMESTIKKLTGYPTFGGTSGYVTLSYDLPATS